MRKVLSQRQVRMARRIAVGADILQVLLFPLMVQGFISPFDDALDLLVCVMLCSLIGWHWALLPSALVKFLPGVDLAPTWTLAVYAATRQRTILEESPQ